MSFQTHNATTMFKAQKGNKDIFKIVHVTPVSAAPYAYIVVLSWTRIFS